MSALIWLSYASLLILGLIDNLRSPFYPDLLADLELSSTLGATFFATTSLFAFVGSWSSHAIVHRRSSLFLMGLASVVMSLGFALISRSQNLYQLIPCCAFFGWGFGAMNLAQNLMIHEAGAPALRRRLYNGLHAMYGVSALAAPLVASLFRWLGADWRTCFLVMAALPLLVLVSGLRLRAPRSPERIEARGLSRGQWAYCLSFSLMMALYLWGEISVSTRLVQWLRADLSYSPDRANLYLGLFSVALLAGRVFFSLVHFARVDNWHILMASAFSSCLFFLLGLHFSPLWFVGSGLCLAPFFPVAMEQISHAFGSKSGEALSFILGAGSLSVVLMHLTLGALTDAFGVGRALYVGPVALLLVGAGLIARELRVRAFRDLNPS